MGIKFPFFDFTICKIYLRTWARRARRARMACGHVGQIEHVGTLGMPFSRLSISNGFYKISKVGFYRVSSYSKICGQKP